jgi:hypothetical protein
METRIWTYWNQTNRPMNKLLMCETIVLPFMHREAAVITDRYQLVTYVKIEIVCAQGVQRFFKTLLDVRLMGVPKLARQEDFLTRHATILDALADLMFVA